MSTSSRLARLLRSARRALSGAPLAALVVLLPLSAACAADHKARASCPPAAQTLTAERLREGLANARDHGFLWRISKDGHASYLYGTIHAAKFEWMFPGPTIIDAIRSSDTIALELDVLNRDIQDRLAASIGPHRTDPLPPQLVRRIEQQMAAECVDAATWSKFAPEFQIASLSVMAARRDGFDPANAADLVLAVLGRNLRKSVVSLETPEAQMQALQMPTQEETIEFVTSGLDELDHHRLLALGVCLDPGFGVGYLEVVERGAGAAHARLAGHHFLVDLRREAFGGPGRLIPDVAPLRLHQLAERVAPRRLVRRVDEHAVDVEYRPMELCLHVPSSRPWISIARGWSCGPVGTPTGPRRTARGRRRRRRPGRAG